MVNYTVHCQSDEHRYPSTTLTNESTTIWFKVGIKLDDTQKAKNIWLNVVIKSGYTQKPTTVWFNVSIKSGDN